MFVLLRASFPGVLLHGGHHLEIPLGIKSHVRCACMFVLLCASFHGMLLHGGHRLEIPNAALRRSVIEDVGQLRRY